MLYRQKFQRCIPLGVAAFVPVVLSIAVTKQVVTFKVGEFDNSKNVDLHGLSFAKQQHVHRYQNKIDRLLF